MINFDEYIRQGEPQKQEKGYAWQTAIGLQAVDGLKPSDYLIETARKDIEGEITIDEAEQLIRSYYQSKIAHTPEDAEIHEADMASTNIRRMKAIAREARRIGADCEVSLENMMACGLGACLCCVEPTVKGNVCVCTEGPVFNINQLTWED